MASIALIQVVINGSKSHHIMGQSNANWPTTLASQTMASLLQLDRDVSRDSSKTTLYAAASLLSL